MPIVAQALIPITITSNHKIIMNAFKECGCISKSSLINKHKSRKDEILHLLDSLTTEGAIKCKDDKCCIKSASFESFVDKLNKLK